MEHMFTIRRASTLLVGVAMLLGGCASTSPGNSSGASQATVPTTAATAAPTTKPRPTVTLNAAQQRPGYLLLEHFGNAADGTRLIDGNPRHLWLVHADGTDLHELAPGLPVADPPTSGKGAADWSPDGRHIVFHASENPLIYETDLEGTTPRLLSTECRGATTCIEFFPAYSPDGKRIAFVRLIPFLTGVIGIRDLTTGKVTLLESTRQGPPNDDLGGPSWSPDGTKLVYFQLPKKDGKPTGGSQMYIVNADGSDRHLLPTPGLAAGDPDWSPDGSLIVFSTEPIHQWNDVDVPDHPDVYVVRPDGTGLQQLTKDQGSGAPSWTSDGKILFFSQRALWLMDADGSNRLRVGPGSMNLVSDSTGYTYYAKWQPVP
jgi:dipeptidyl aminopeptidase/acylaminoacyl peptidase